MAQIMTSTNVITEGPKPVTGSSVAAVPIKNTYKPGDGESPEDHVLSLAWAAADSANIGAVVRLGIVEHIPADSTVSASELATATGLSKRTVLRLVRYAICNGVFTEPSLGHFAHSAASKALADSQHLRDVVELSTYEISSILAKLPEALGKQRDEPGKLDAAFNLAYPQSANVFEYFANDPVAAARYHKYLNGRVNTPRWSVKHLLSAWDWASIGSGTVVDLGGSSGHTCRALAPLCPAAHFTVQDFSDDALAMGRAAVAADAALAGRIAFAKHDFFTPQTLRADVYVIRHILHDWSDADSVAILRNLVPALADGARVLISEGIMPEGPAVRAATLDEKQVRIEDAFMLAVHNAEERTVEDFVRLFREASPGYHFVGVTGGGKGEFQSLLEFRYEATAGCKCISCSLAQQPLSISVESFSCCSVPSRPKTASSEAVLLVAGQPMRSSAFPSGCLANARNRSCMRWDNFVSNFVGPALESTCAPDTRGITEKWDAPIQGLRNKVSIGLNKRRKGHECGALIRIGAKQQWLGSVSELFLSHEFQAAYLFGEESCVAASDVFGRAVGLVGDCADGEAQRRREAMVVVRLKHALQLRRAHAAHALDLSLANGVSTAHGRGNGVEALHLGVGLCLDLRRDAALADEARHNRVIGVGKVENLHRCRAGRMAPEEDAVGIATKGSGVVARPLESEALVLEADVAQRRRQGAGIGEAEDVQALATVHPDQDGQLLAFGMERSNDIEIEAVFIVRRRGQKAGCVLIVDCLVVGEPLRTLGLERLCVYGMRHATLGHRGRESKRANRWLGEGNAIPLLDVRYALVDEATHLADSRVDFEAGVVVVAIGMRCGKHEQALREQTKGEHDSTLLGMPWTTRRYGASLDSTANQNRRSGGLRVRSIVAEFPKAGARDLGWRNCGATLQSSFKRQVDATRHIFPCALPCRSADKVVVDGAIHWLCAGRVQGRAGGRQEHVLLDAELGQVVKRLARLLRVGNGAHELAHIIQPRHRTAHAGEQHQDNAARVLEQTRLLRVGEVRLVQERRVPDGGVGAVQQEEVVAALVGWQLGCGRSKDGGVLQLCGGTLEVVGVDTVAGSDATELDACICADAVLDHLLAHDKVVALELLLVPEAAAVDDGRVGEAQIDTGTERQRTLFGQGGVDVCLLQELCVPVVVVDGGLCKAFGHDAGLLELDAEADMHDRVALHDVAVAMARNLALEKVDKVEVVVFKPKIGGELGGILHLAHHGFILQLRWLALVEGVAAVLSVDGVGVGTQRPESHAMVDNVVVQVHALVLLLGGEDVEVGVVLPQAGCDGLGTLSGQMLGVADARRLDGIQQNSRHGCIIAGGRGGREQDIFILQRQDAAKRMRLKSRRTIRRFKSCKIALTLLAARRVGGVWPGICLSSRRAGIGVGGRLSSIQPPVLHLRQAVSVTLATPPLTTACRFVSLPRVPLQRLSYVAQAALSQPYPPVRGDGPGPGPRLCRQRHPRRPLPRRVDPRRCSQPPENAFREEVDHGNYHGICDPGRQLRLYCIFRYGRQVLYFVTMGLVTIFGAGSCGANNIATLLVLRFLAGATGASAIVNSAGVIADIFAPRDRGLAVTVYSSAPFLGNSLNQLAYANQTNKAGWRWTDGLTVAFTGIMWIAGVLMVPETYAPVLLKRRAEDLSRRTGRVYRSKIDVDKGSKTAAELFSVTIKRPWVILAVEPIALLLSVYSAIIYGTLYLIFSAFPIVFRSQRGWGQGVSSLSFLGVMVGQILAMFFSVVLDKRYKAYLSAHGGTAPPEQRLWPCLIGCVMMPVGLFWFAFTTFPADTLYAASALASNAILRALPLFTTQMYKNLGVQWASSIPAFLALACVPFPFLFYKYGAAIRKRCPYAAESARVTDAIHAQGQKQHQQEVVPDEKHASDEEAAGSGSVSPSDSKASN
ncbi:hypothetical protein FH972_021730 [Carpinus fangiana]|uniref:O-methyltransferase C-terminal domain-containing protein n=1 Tax=Carpinus fangiana TaxID=176857 RepID=A0A5N6KQ72_9ROSI|nr:hypothetical protein FH972_021730 [Carpinus fangiana]